MSNEVDSHGPSHRTVTDLIEPCPHCGVPCSGTYRFETVEGRQLVAVEIDQPTVDVLFDDLLAFGDYAELPRLVREWNEVRGWCDVNPSRSTVQFEPAEITSMVDAMRRAGAIPPGHSERQYAFLDALEELTACAVELGTSIAVHDD